MKIKKLLFLAAIGLTASATLTSCEDILGTWDRPTPAAVTPSSESAVAVTSITLNKTEVTLAVGETFQLEATVKPDNATNADVDWDSGDADQSVATISGAGLITAVASGTTTFVVKAGDKEATCTVTVKISGLLAGVFTVNDSPLTKVQFSQGNLQATYDGSEWIWTFAANQWDYIGNAEGNTKVTNATPFVSDYTGASTTVDLFGWVGESSTWTGVNQYGITSSNVTNAVDGYGNGSSESLKSDWGTNIGTGWRTLTSAEWTYLFQTRTDAASKYGYATVAGKNGIIIVPDEFTDPMKNNGSNAFVGSTTTGFDANVYTEDNWTAMETAGCVFLPAAGLRYGTSVNGVGSSGYYWSSSPYGSSADFAYDVIFNSGNLYPAFNYYRNFGFSVRLVRPAE